MSRAVRPWFLISVVTLALMAACSSDGGAATTPSDTVTATLLTPPPATTPRPSTRPSPRPTPSGPTASPHPEITPHPSPTDGSAQVIQRGLTTSLLATLTFDAGSDVGYTSQILDTLSSNHIPAAFGITGQWVERYPDLLKRIVSDGHELINHSYDHASFTGGSTNTMPLTQAQRWDQLDRTDDIVWQLTGASTLPYFRPPYGSYDDSVNADVGARGYLYNIMWTVDSGGWRGFPASKIAQVCLDGAQPGVIYVFHVGSASQDGPALQSIIDGLHAGGYTIIPLSHMIGR